AGQHEGDMDDLTIPAFPAASAADPVRGRFTGPMPVYRRLMIRGAFLQVLTLGIYRFWLTTDMRRFLWANTEVGGESAEYTGTAIELLIGFLIAIAILVPIFVLIALAGLSLGPAGQFAGLVGYVILGVLGQYAYFRARRYRLTRTVFRGVRLHQTGSAWRYAFRSILWGIAIVFTLGLAYPFAQASLERYKLSRTWYGDLQGAFAGSGAVLLLRGLLLWLILLVPVIATIAYAIETVDWHSIAAGLRSGAARDPGFFQSNAAFKRAAGAVFGAFGWFFLAVVVLYPAFQAIVLRWWLNGLRIGSIAVSSRLRMRSVYGAYLRYLGWTTLVTLVGALIFGAIALLIPLLFTTQGIGKEKLGILGAIGGFVAYLALAFCVWIIYQVAVKLRLWRIMADSVEITGFKAIENVRADATVASSAVGEGLVDALGAGGM
ncbi:MAG TPA: DUF898 family protein, partial [Xanthobacteraceae bacterium]|nr:DUF898 family protein [Xanthobacteraceae bacterium]